MWGIKRVKCEEKKESSMNNLLVQSEEIKKYNNRNHSSLMRGIQVKYV